MVALFFCSCCIRIFCFNYNQTVFDTKGFYIYDNSSLWATFCTLLMLLTVGNWPDLMLTDPEYQGSSATLYGMIVFMLLLLIHNLLLGVNCYWYNKIFIEELRDLNNHHYLIEAVKQ